jgi:hypothetical protein
MRIDVRFHVNGHQVGLPGEVAWIASAGAGATNIGVALNLELAPAADRQRWAEWIVSETRSAPARPSEDTVRITRPR